jgi:CRP-like cAMP-binding protein
VLYLKELFPEHQWTRKEIADFCCSTTPTVSRTLASFEASGFIRQIGRKIEIIKREPLLELAASD